jgi:hypothetical protein
MHAKITYRAGEHREGIQIKIGNHTGQRKEGDDRKNLMTVITQ